MTKNVFISHSSEDSTVANDICGLFEKRGIECWIAPRDSTSGISYGEDLIDAIRSVQAVVLILSEHSNKSDYVRNEIERAVKYGKTIFTIRIRNVEVSKKLEFFVAASQWVDAWDPPVHQIINKLANTIRTFVGGSQISPDDFNKIEEKVHAIADQLRKQPFAAASFKEDLHHFAELIENTDLLEKQSPYISAIVYRLYAGAIFMTPTNEQLANPIRKGLPWLQKSLELNPDFNDIAQLKMAKNFFGSVLQEKVETTDLKKFLLHQAVVVMINASNAEVNKAVETSYMAIKNIISSRN